MGSFIKQVTLNKFTKEECSRKNPAQKRSPNGILDSQICYGSRNDSKDTCSVSFFLLNKYFTK